MSSRRGVGGGREGERGKQGRRRRRREGGHQWSVPACDLSAPFLKYSGEKHRKNMHARTYTHTQMCVLSTHTHTRAQGGVFLNLYRAQCRVGELVWQHTQHSAEPTSGQQDVRGRGSEEPATPPIAPPPSYPRTPPSRRLPTSPVWELCQ